MTRLHMFLARLWMRWRRSRVEQDIDEEIRSHLDMATDDARRQGLTPEEPRLQAIRDFGSVTQVKERYRDLSRFPDTDALLHDVRFSLRTLRKNPGFTVLAVAMLALGIGVNAAVFTVIDAALFQGWPLVREHRRIVQLSTARDGANNGIAYPDFEEWQSQTRTLEGMALIRGEFHTLSDGGGTPETYFTTQVTANTFSLLGVEPLLGRDFSPADTRPGAEPVVILRYEVWAARFAANRAIIGQRVRIDGRPATVIGVLPPGFSFPYPWRFDLCTPLIPPTAALQRGAAWGGSFAFARLADGATLTAARVELETIGRRLASVYPDTNRGLVPVVKGFREWFVGPEAATLYEALWGAVGFILLIVCANVANLLMAHASGRSHEISIRLALGAGRWRIVRQFLVESLALSALGGIGGWWIAKAGVRLYVLTQLHEDVLRFTMDRGVFAYLGAISLATGVLAGLATAAYLTKLPTHGVAKDEARGITAGRHGRRLSGFFVAAEMFLAVVLLAAAAVTSRSLLNVFQADLGADTANVLTMDLYTPPDQFPSPEARLSFYREIGAHLQALPGVESVSFGAAPTERVPRVPYELADAPAADQRSRRSVAEVVVSPGYFHTLRATLVSGRDFEAADDAARTPAAIVNQEFARLNWPGEAALGKRLRIATPGEASAPWLTVVGVVSNIVQNDRTRQAFEPLVYVPDAQHAAATFALVRTTVAPATLAAAVRREIYALHPDLRIAVMKSLSERLDQAYGFERNVTLLLLIFALFALLLASAGLYAAVSHAVSKLSHEIGIRVAIGASSPDIFRFVFRHGMAPVSIGLALGLAASLAANRVVQAQLVGVSPGDPAMLIAATTTLLVSAGLACWIPARRAARVDPIAALKHE